VRRTKTAIFAAAMAVAIPLSDALADGPRVPVKAMPPAPPPPPMWTWEFGLDGVYAGRTKAPGDFVAQAFGTTEPFITGSDFDFDREFGGDARLRLRRDMLAFEARYFGGFNFGSTFSGDTPLDFFFSGNAPVNLGGASFPFTSSYSSRLHSAEANLRFYSASTVVWFAGVRWLELSETFQFLGDILDYRMRTKSSGVGPQIGFDWRAIAPQQANGFFVDFDARLAWLFGDQRASFRFPPTFSGNGSSDRGMLAAEFAATLGYQISPNAEWRLGYRVLWLDNVALATAQVQNSSLTGGTVNVTRDDLWIHGVTFGFVVRH
jgi:hypothetical protein